MRNACRETLLYLLAWPSVLVASMLIYQSESHWLEATGGFLILNAGLIAGRYGQLRIEAAK